MLKIFRMRSENQIVVCTEEVCNARKKHLTYPSNMQHLEHSISVQRVQKVRENSINPQKIQFYVAQKASCQIL